MFIFQGVSTDGGGVRARLASKVTTKKDTGPDTPLTSGTSSRSSNKKCVIRKGRCVSDRVDLTEKKAYKRILTGDGQGKLVSKMIEVTRLVCSRQEEREAMCTDSVGKGKLRQM